MKFLKIVPNTFVHENRDERELQTVESMGWEVVVVAKAEEEAAGNPQPPFTIKRVSTRPLAPRISSPMLNRLWAVKVWISEVRTQKADILSCHDLVSLFIGWAASIGRRKRVKIIYDSHEFEYGRNSDRSALAGWAVCRAERLLIRRCDMTMVVNDTIADEVVKLHRLSQRPLVVRNIPEHWTLDPESIAATRHKILAENGLPEETFLLKYHGMVTRGRGAEICIRAIAQLPGTALLVLGSGETEYIEQLKALAAQVGVSSRVIFHPAVPRSELWRYAGAADLGLCLIENTCASYYYSLPNKLFEDIQSLVPVLGSNFPEIARIVEGYGVGRCCDPSDLSDIVATVRSLQANPARLAAFRSNQKKAKKLLCWENERQRLAEAYQSLTKQTKT